MGQTSGITKARTLLDVQSIKFAKPERIARLGSYTPHAPKHLSKPIKGRHGSSGDRHDMIAARAQHFRSGLESPVHSVSTVPVEHHLGRYGHLRPRAGRPAAVPQRPHVVRLYTCNRPSRPLLRPPLPRQPAPLLCVPHAAGVARQLQPVAVAAQPSSAALLRLKDLWYGLTCVQHRTEVPVGMGQSRYTSIDVRHANVCTGIKGDGAAG